MEASLLSKYLSGECTEEEKKKVRSWISESEENRNLLRNMKKIWDVEPRDEFQPEISAGYEQVKKRLRQNRHTHMNLRDGAGDPGWKSSYKANYPSSHESRRSYVWTAAAAIIVLISILSLLQFIPQQSEPAVSERQAFETARGERASFTLRDGSKVTLNADSRLEVSSEFDSGRREIFLQGEAYFEVVPDRNRPFIIYSKQTYTRVLGTKFGISAYPGDSKVYAVVEEGRVRFGIQPDSAQSGEAAELKANEMAEVEKSGTIRQQLLTHSMAQYLGWKDGKLVFEKTPLRQIIPRLERWYNITVDLDNADLGERLLTATFREESLNEVLGIIALSLDLNYRRPADHKVIFSDITEQS